jgi:hypothetical protein
VPIVKVNYQNRMKEVAGSVRVIPALILLMLFCSGLAVAQIPATPRPSPTPPPRPIDGTLKRQDDTPLTTFEEELRAKRAIKMAEKDHEENLKRAREIAQLGKDLQQILKDKAVLDRASLKKVERLEKLTKKVRSEAGGDDEDVTLENRPSDFSSTVIQIADLSATLSKDVQDTPRQVISASVIGNANMLLELIKMLRGFAGLP